MAEREGIRAVAEMRSVNHRFLDIKIRGSSLEPAVEERIKGQVRNSCGRGSVTLSMRLERHGTAAAMRVDNDVAKGVYDQLVHLAQVLGLDVPVSLELVCQQPGVWVPADADADAPRVAECVNQAVKSALAGLVGMRETEGQTLENEIANRLENLRTLVTEVTGYVEGATEAAQARMHERIARLLKNTNIEVSEDRLAHEIAVLADKLDITEELVRLRGHIDHMTRIMNESRAQQSAIGRRLDFLAQEIGREINTVGSKSQSADIARAVIDAKAELEKIREQVQNIE